MTHLCSVHDPPVQRAWPACAAGMIATCVVLLNVTVYVMLIPANQLGQDGVHRKTVQMTRATDELTKCLWAVCSCSQQAVNGRDVLCRRRERSSQRRVDWNTSHLPSPPALSITHQHLLGLCQARRYLTTRKSRRSFALLTASTAPWHLHRQLAVRRQNRKQSRSVARLVFLCGVMVPVSIDFITTTTRFI